MDLRRDYGAITDDPEYHQRCKKMLTYLAREMNITIPHSTGPVWAVGKTLVFFKQITYEKISQRRLKIRSDAVIRIQAYYRMVKQSHQFKKIRYCVNLFQMLILSKTARD